MASGKKQLKNFHKHEELLLDELLINRPVIPGFMVYIDLEIAQEDFAREEFRSDYLVVALVTRGSLTMSVDLKQYNLKKNDLIVASPNALKRLVDAEEHSTLSMVSFTADFLNNCDFPNLSAELFDYFTTKFSPLWILNEEAAKLVSDLIEQLYKRSIDVNEHVYGKEILLSVFQIFLYELGGLSKVYADPINIYMSRKENLVMAFIQLAQKECITQRSVKELASRLAITPKYLTETVKEITGKNAGEIIDDFVILEAKHLLGNPALNISQIANRLNFNDQSFFGKYFKRLTGTSPKEYRSTLY